MSTLLNERPLTNPENNASAHLAKLMEAYQADQQLKYLHLQAEVEVLLQQLQTLKQRRLASTASPKE